MDVKVSQRVTVVQMVPSITAGGAHDAVSTEQDCDVPSGPQRTTVLRNVTDAAAVHVVTVVTTVKSTVAEMRKVAKMKSVVTPGVLLWKLQVALDTAQLMPVIVPAQTNGAHTVPVVSCWKQKSKTLSTAMQSISVGGGQPVGGQGPGWIAKEPSLLLAVSILRMSTRSVGLRKA